MSPAPQLAPPPRRGYVATFDGLRAIAVALVVLYHLGAPKVQGNDWHFGWIGVDLFFALSGFLITGILLDGIRRPGSQLGSRASAGAQMGRFYWRRLLRIFPLYYATLLALFLLAPFVTQSELVLLPAEQAPYYLTFLQNLQLDLIDVHAPSLFLTHTWSLAVEEQFYLVWPWLILFLPRRALAVILAFVLLASPVARAYYLAIESADWLHYWNAYKNTFFHLDGLVAGSLLALATRSRSVSRRGVARFGFVASAFGIGASAWLLGRMPASAIPLTKGYWVEGTLLFSALALGSTGLVALCWSQRSAFLSWTLANPVVRYVGRISFGIYLLHWPVILSLRTLPGLQAYDHPAVAVAATLVLASLSWFGLERPLLRYRES